MLIETFDYAVANREKILSEIDFAAHETTIRRAKDQTQPVYETLLNQNLVAWEDEFALFLADYRSTKNAEALLASVDSLFERYKIGARKLEERRELHEEELMVVGYMFLSRPGEVFPMLS